MDEKQWLTCTAPKWMLEHIRHQEASARKLRLFACASLRRVAVLGEPSGLRALQTVEAFAEGQVSHAEAVRACSDAIIALQGRIAQRREDAVKTDPTIR